VCNCGCHQPLQAMQEAEKHLAKSRTTDREAQVAALQEASDRISRFVQAHSLLDQDPAAAVMLCQQLLQEAPEQLVSAAPRCRQVRQGHSTSQRWQHNRYCLRHPCVLHCFGSASVLLSAWHAAAVLHLCPRDPSPT
jgi:hypothetical protein